MKRFKALREADHDHPAEVAGRRLRALMPWLEPRHLPEERE